MSQACAPSSHPCRSSPSQGRFYVGLGAHDWGRPVENLADDRFLGAPETAALFYGSMTAYARQYGCTTGIRTGHRGTHPVCLRPRTQAATSCPASARGWSASTPGRLRTHEDTPDVEAFDLSVQSVDVTSQAAGAMFDYFLDEQGEFIPARKPDYKKEIGIVSVGMNTLELLVIRNGAPVERFLASETAGVRRLLEIIDPSGLYSRGELDTQLRTRQARLPGCHPGLGQRDRRPHRAQLGQCVPPLRHDHRHRRWCTAPRRCADGAL